jgi:Flp pilus assembly protein TadB
MAENERSQRRSRDRAGARAAERAERKRTQGDTRRKREVKAQDHLPLERANLILFAVALAVIVAGYLALAAGSITLAPILLVLGYCVLVPVAIVYRPRRPVIEAGPAPGADPDPKGE